MKKNEPELQNKPTEEAKSSNAELISDIASQEKLMKAAQRFSISFDQDRRWSDEMARLSFTLQAWRELASAAVEFAQHNQLRSHPPE